jgi:hypothetical protein
MALNAQLYDAGLLDDFYKAASRKDRTEMISLLISIEINMAEAEKTADAVLESPAFI